MKKEKKVTEEIDLDVLVARIEELEAQAELSEKIIEDAKSAQMRALADLHNYQRRESENKQNWDRDAVSGFLEKLIPRVVELELGVAHTEDKHAKKTMQHFLDTLEKLGLNKINPKKNTPIDTNLHEILMVAEGLPDCVVEVLESGWGFKDRLLKPAKVSAGITS